MKILTFDIEDWYNHDDYSQDFEWDKFECRLNEGIDKILSALDNKRITGTFMCLGWIAEKHPEIIQRISQQGHDIGCHSYQHQLATRFSPIQFKEDTYKAKCLLEDVSGKEVDAYRVPSFSITKDNTWTFDILAELGFKYDSSIFPSQHEFGGIPEFEAKPTKLVTKNGIIKEFPISLGKMLGREIVYSGGGYFRVMPYWLLRKLTNESEYVMSYFHPSDFDPKQPQMPQLSKMRQFKNRVALKGSYEKFCKYISDYRFFNIREADALVEWDKEKTIVFETVINQNYNCGYGIST